MEKRFGKRRKGREGPVKSVKYCRARIPQGS